MLGNKAWLLQGRSFWTWVSYLHPHPDSLFWQALASSCGDIWLPLFYRVKLADHLWRHLHLRNWRWTLPRRLVITIRCSSHLCLLCQGVFISHVDADYLDVIEHELLFVFFLLDFLFVLLLDFFLDSLLLLIGLVVIWKIGKQIRPIFCNLGDALIRLLPLVAACLIDVFDIEWLDSAQVKHIDWARPF